MSCSGDAMISEQGGTRVTVANHLRSESGFFTIGASPSKGQGWGWQVFCLIMFEFV